MWLKRHWQLALGCGLGLGGPGQLAVALLARQDFEPTPAQRFAAFVYTAVCLAAAAHLYALVSGRLLGRGRLRPGLVGLSALGFSVLALVLATGVVFRIASGTYLTAGVLMFTMNGSDAIAHAAQGEYLRWAIAGVVALAAFLALSVWLLGPASRSVTPPRRRDWTLAVVLVALVGAVFWRRADSRFTRGMFVGAPLLALVSSFDVEVASGGSGSGVPAAPPGPPRAAELGWKAAVERAAREGCDGKPCPRPNVVLVILESLAPGHLSALGYARPTPAIDRLLREGLFFSRAWTTATHSNYAQPAILSSLFPRRGRGLDQYQELDYPRFLFHDLFHALGYDTATISSQDEDWQGMRRFQSTGTPTHYWYADDYRGEALDSGVERTAPDEATTEEVLAWLARPRTAPFALYVNFQGTHFPYTLSKGTPRPYQPEEPDWSSYSYLRYPETDREAVTNRYDNALAHVDRQLARLRSALEASGKLDDTLIAITADHGELFFDRGMVTHGRTLYDVESRVPIAFRWPGRVPVEERKEPASHLDVMPTIAALLGLPPHPSWQGRSLASPGPVTGGPPAIYLNIQGLRFADALVCWPYKLMIDRTGKQPHLYDLERDPHEEQDRIEVEPAIAAALTDSMTRQLVAQLDYHADASVALRRERFAPRLRPCPVLPAPQSPWPSPSAAAP